MPYFWVSTNTVFLWAAVTITITIILQVVT